MSRCFPYPPPGHLSNGVRGEAVRDPIKFKRGRENTISELDSKKKNDKKQRKEKKYRKKNDKVNKEHAYMVDTYNLYGRSPLQKGKVEEAERSDLTEEHEQPVYSLNVCHSPDSSGWGNKGKLVHSASISKAYGNILRIRLPLQRHIELDATLKAEGVCSDSGNVESLAHQAETRTTCPHESNPVTSNSEVGSKSVTHAYVADLKVKDSNAKTGSVSLHEKKEHNVDSPCKTLIEDWIPPSLEFDQPFFDDSWLLPSNEQGFGSKRLSSSHVDRPCHERSKLWPCALYLPVADVYALPYSIPF